MSDCCNNKESELRFLATGARRRVLQAVLAINLFMFVLEFGAGVIARSTALMADSIDMLGDAFVYALSLYALSRGDRWKAGAAMAKGIIILLFGVWILVEVITKLESNVTPTTSVMAIVGTAALLANLACLALLWPHRRENINMSSTFECSRNDVIANIGVLIAAGGVWLTSSGWPDLVAGCIVAALFLWSAVKVLKEAWPKVRASPSVGSAG